MTPFYSASTTGSTIMCRLISNVPYLIELLSIISKLKMISVLRLLTRAFEDYEVVIDINEYIQHVLYFVLSFI